VVSGPGVNKALSFQGGSEFIAKSFSQIIYNKGQ
jgi:hypothetical protein